MGWAEDWYRRALAGEFGAAPSAPRTAEEHAFAAAVAAARALADGSREPALADLEALAREPDAMRGVSFACHQLARAAFVSLDLGRLGRVLGVQRSASDEIALGVVEALHAWLAAEAIDPARLAELESIAQKRALPDLVIDCAALRALHLLEGGDRDGALKHARRAARMARTEAMPQTEYFAHAVLARLRRHCGHPHLATRIAVALARVAPPAWAPWLEIELSLAGSGASHPSEGARPGFVGAVRAWIDRSSRARPEVPPAYRAEIGALAAMLDLDAQCEDERCARWLDGTSAEFPLGLGGLSGDDGAFLVLRPGAPARRVLRLPPGIELRRSSRPGRLETAIAVLATSGDTIDKESFFRAVYGFEFRAELHRGPLEVLVHRTRQLAAGAAEIARAEETLALRVAAPFAVPDPRTVGTGSQRLLRSLAAAGRQSAKDAANAAGVPLRTAQTALKQLAEEGACTVERRGREIEYVIEDTTFSEPTNAR